MIRETDPRLLRAINFAEKGLNLRYRPHSRNNVERALESLSDEELLALMDRLIRIGKSRHVERKFLTRQAPER
jgi:hypothetical protein